MKMWIFLIAGLSVCFAKAPPNNHRFPDILAPLRGMFVSSRGSEKQFQPSLHDATGAETSRPGVHRPGEEKAAGYQIQAGSGSDPRNHFKPEGRAVAHFHADPRHYPHPFPLESRSPLQYSREGPSLFPLNPERPPFAPNPQPQQSSDPRPPPQFQEGRSIHTQFNQESRPHPQFLPESTPEFRPLPSFGPEIPTSFHRRPTRHYQPHSFPIPQSYDHRSPPQPQYVRSSPSQTQGLDDEKSTGFTDFAFNPADFDRTAFGSAIGGDERPRYASREDRSLFNPPKPILFGSDLPRNDFPPENRGSLPDEGEILTVDDIHKGSSVGKMDKVYFDDVYRQSPGNLPFKPMRFQREQPNESASAPTRHLSQSKFRPHRDRDSREANFGENRAKEMFKHKSDAQNHILYGKPMLMSGSSTSAPVISQPNDKNAKQEPMTSASVHEPNMRWDAEPIAAASGHGNEISGNHGDRILYHVAGHAGPYSYRFGYDTGSGYNRMFRHEEKDGKGLVKGKYGFHDKTGKLQVVNYSAHPTEGFHSERAH